MKTTEKYIDEIFDFKGLWDMPSKCGLKIMNRGDEKIVIVSELYQDNPGTSITQAASLLAKQICDYFALPYEKMIYIEHNPGMNSKLSFYDEDFFLVEFDLQNNNFTNTKYKKLKHNEIEEFFN